MIDIRFGGGTWDKILLERKERIEKHNKKVAAQKRKKDEAKKRWIKTLETIGSFIIVGATTIIAFYLIISNMKK